MCENLNFHTNLVFSAVLGHKLAANLPPPASRSTTMTPWHPQKLVPPMCFQSLVGCLRPTTHFETLRKDPEWVFQFVKDKISSLNEDKYVHTAKFSPCELKNVVGVFAQSLRVRCRPQAAYLSLKAHWRRKLLRMTWGDCDGPGCWWR